MMRTLPPTTLANLDPRAVELARAAEAAALRSLRRVPGTDGAEWNRTGGTLLDSSRLAARAMLPGARIFGRRADERGARPTAAVTVLIDDSGSMGARDSGTISRAHRAAAVCTGIVRGADACGLPAIVARHTTRGGDDIALSVFDSCDTLNAWTMRSDMNGNRDALAVIATVAHVPFLAPRGVFVLIADGEPTDPESEHRNWCRDALRSIQGRGYSFVYAFVGHESDRRSIERARREWGPARVADCSRDPNALARVMVAAAARVR